MNVKKNNMQENVQKRTCKQVKMNKKVDEGKFLFYNIYINTYDHNVEYRR